MVNALLDKLAWHRLPEIMVYIHVYNIYFSSNLLIMFTVYLLNLYEYILTGVLT